MFVSIIEYVSKYNYNYHGMTYCKLKHLIKKYLDGGATEAEGRTSVPVGASVAISLLIHIRIVE